MKFRIRKLNSGEFVAEVDRGWWIFSYWKAIDNYFPGESRFEWSVEEFKVKHGSVATLDEASSLIRKKAKNYFNEIHN